MAGEAVSVIRDTGISVQWRIKKFFDLPQQHGKCLDSPAFRLSNAEWCISIFPNGDNRENSRGWISLFLKRKTSTREEHEVSFTCGMKKTCGTVFKSVKFESVTFTDIRTCGKAEFLKRSELYASIDVVTPDGSVTFFCNARILDDTHFNSCVEETASQTLSADGVETLSKNFKDLYLGGSDYDLKITVGRRDFRAHKLILAARSKVFASMFQHDMTENISGVVKISDCDPESFQDFLLFIYTGQTNHVSPSNALGLYRTAEKYDLVELKLECSRLLSDEVSVDSVFDIVQLATMYNDSEMLRNATNFFINNSQVVLATDKWRAFFAENVLLANELVMQMAKKLQRRAEK